MGGFVMDEKILKDILASLQEMNSKLDEILYSTEEGSVNGDLMLLKNEIQRLKKRVKGENDCSVRDISNKTQMLFRELFEIYKIT